MNLIAAEVSATFDGVVLVDKPQGLTSHDVVQRMRRILKTRAIGHTGTLDPLATGLMLVVVGKATRLSDYLMASDKAYEVTVALGQETDTWDADGRVVHECALVDLAEEDVRAAVRRHEGEFEWPVPAYSAVKRDGKKLCDQARRDEEVPEVFKLMAFESLEVLGVWGTSCRVRMTCSKGSYVRTWAQMLGQDLGVGAHVKELRRIAVGSYSVSSAVTLAQLEEGLRPPGAFVDLKQVLPHWPVQRVTGKDEALIRNGQIPHKMQGPLMSILLRAAGDSSASGVRMVSGETGDLISLALPSPTGKFRLGCVLAPN